MSASRRGPLKRMASSGLDLAQRPELQWEVGCIENLNSSRVVAVERRLRRGAAGFPRVHWRVEPQTQMVRVDWSEADSFGCVREHAIRVDLRWRDRAR